MKNLRALVPQSLQAKFLISGTAILFAAVSVYAFPKTNKPAKPAARPAPQQIAASPLLAVMSAELDRSMPVLTKADPPAYFINYTVTESQRTNVSGSNGALLDSSENRNRWLEAQVRVGNYDLDNTHKVGGTQPAYQPSPGTAVPLEEDASVIRRAIWLETDKQYRNAAEALIKIKTSKEVQVQSAEGSAPDFSREKPHNSVGAHVAYQLDRKPW
ncbi:MAG TPA: hypothetical protein VFO34_16565, partial [Candidatus Acidoferrales bacterium]|nr:hypothetical protein [Candidatus Acidoferrales bacterium]